MKFFRFLTIYVSWLIVAAFGIVGVIHAAQIRDLHDWAVLRLMLAFIVPLSWLVALAITNRE